MVFPPQPQLTSALPWASALPLGKNLFVHEMHQDCVQELPQGATLLGSSERTEVEAWSLGNHILCIQGDCLFAPCGSSCTQGWLRVLSWMHVRGNMEVNISKNILPCT